MEVMTTRVGGTGSPSAALTVDTSVGAFSPGTSHRDTGLASPLSTRAPPLALTPSSSTLAFRPLTAGDGVVSLIEGTTVPAPAPPPGNPPPLAGGFILTQILDTPLIKEASNNLPTSL